MGKTRVHELAKEFDVSAKEILTFLSGHNIDATSHMSALEDDAVVLVRNKYGKKTTAPENVNEAKKERPKKKASISAVYNPQNSKMGDRRPGNGQRNAQGARNGQNRPQRPLGERPARPNGDRPERRCFCFSPQPLQLY